MDVRVWVDPTNKLPIFVLFIGAIQANIGYKDEANDTIFKPFDEALTNRSVSVSAGNYYTNIEVGPCPVQLSDQITVKWIRPISNIRISNYEQINDEKKIRVLKEGSARQSSSLSIKSFSSDKQGWYTCTAWNNTRPREIHYSNIYLEMDDGSNPERPVVSKLYRQYDENRSKVTFRCELSSGRAVTIEWFKVDSNLTIAHKDIAEIRKRGTLLKNLTTPAQNAKRYTRLLTGPKSEGPSQGNYVCLASNELGTDHKSIYFSAPQQQYHQDTSSNPERPVVSKLYRQYDENRSKVTFRCELSSGRAVTIEWFKVDSNLTIAHKDIAEIRKRGTLLKNLTTPAQNAKRYTRLLTGPKSEGPSQGNYVCLASNELGTDHKSIYFSAPQQQYHQDTRKSKSFRTIIIFASITIAIVIFCIIIFGIIIMRKLAFCKKWKDTSKLGGKSDRVVMIHWVKTVVIEKPNQTSNASSEEAMAIPEVKIERKRILTLDNESGQPYEFELSVDPEWEFRRDHLKLGECLGEGYFGRVMKAEAFSISEKHKTTIVAVKMLKVKYDSFEDVDLISLVQEMEIMKTVGRHENVLALLGCCTQRGPLYVIVEYAEHGNLRDFLRRHRPTTLQPQPQPQPQPDHDHDHQSALAALRLLTDRQDEYCLSQRTLVSFAHQIARGMQFLASKRCVHRDLAARNVLVSENHTMKIADFGLAKDVNTNDYYRKTTADRLPVRWMAPESLLHGKFSTRSDVWSFGILLWEIMTFGQNPYHWLSSIEELPGELQRGYRMPNPPFCPLEIYMLMRCCWLYDESERLSFGDLVVKLNSILMDRPQEQKNYENLSYSSLQTSEASLGSDFAERDNSVYEYNLIDLAVSSPQSTSNIDTRRNRAM